MNNEAWQDFLTAARGGIPARVPVALIVDSPYIPSAFGMNTLDFFMYPDRWLNAYLTLIARFPDVVLLPGFWVEYGMANEPSAFGTSILWRQDQPPAIHHLNLPVEAWSTLARSDPYADGLMALVLRRYWNLEHEGELPEPHRIHFVAARGPFAVATNLFGATNFLTAVADEPDSTRAVLDILDLLTDNTIRFLQAQLGCLREPLGVLVLDDVVGMLSPSQFNRLAVPYMQRIFSAFPGLIRIYHNDTPCKHLLPHLKVLDFDVFNFSHKLHIGDVKAALGPGKAVMGNVPPLEAMVYGSVDEVRSMAHECVARAGTGGGLILSAGGGLNTGTPPENIDALVQVARGG